MSHRASCIAAILLAALLWPAAAPAAESRLVNPRARALLQRGAEEYAAGRFAEAARLLREGHKLEPHPDFLYALGQAERKANRCAEAIAAYQEFLRHAPPEREATPARLNLERCQAQLAEEAARARRAPPKPRPRPPATEARSQRPRPLYRDALGGVLAGAAVSALAVSLAGLLLANGATLDANQATVYREREEALARRDRYRVMGIVGVAAGAGAAVAAMARYLWLARRSARWQVGLAPGAQGVVLDARASW